ncbi:MAG: transcriptional regulator domain-containing protein [Alphaproteobacteria bacterium]
MSLDPSHWRSASEYEYSESLTAPDLAWEWLRRNADYQRDYADAKRNKKDPQDLTRLVRQSWGLRFPDQSAAGCFASRGLLAAGDRPRHGHPDSENTGHATGPHLLAGNRRDRHPP